MAQRSSSGREEPTGSRILVVEDDPVVSDFLERGLRAHGHITTVSDDSAPALSLAASGEFDLILLDLGLPGGDGLDLLRGVRTRGHEVPVIVLTGQVGERDMRECLEAGADDYMAKPFRLDELLARIATQLRRPGSAREP